METFLFCVWLALVYIVCFFIWFPVLISGIKLEKEIKKTNVDKPARFNVLLVPEFDCADFYNKPERSNTK